ncbi:tumor necrosis factor receptor superfamily member 5 [Liasis olivaceus]
MSRAAQGGACGAPRPLSPPAAGREGGQGSREKSLPLPPPPAGQPFESLWTKAGGGGCRRAWPSSGLPSAGDSGQAGDRLGQLRGRPWKLSAPPDWPAQAGKSAAPPLHPCTYKGSGMGGRAAAAPMEGRRWSVGLLAVTLLESLALVQGLSCSGTQYLWNNRCCSRCPPGQKVEEDCSGESNTRCGPCEEHHFQSGWTKERYCTPHRSCSQQAGLTVHWNGNKEQDVICQCQEGTHCSNRECQTCRPHRLCGPGEGVHRAGSHENDTVCIQCPWGFFSNVSSSTARCQPWSSCKGNGIVWKANGTRATDVTCGSPPSPAPPPKANPNLLVLLPLAALLLGALLLLWHQRGKCARKRLQGHQNPPQEPPEPTENEEDCPTFPTQETPLGEQMGIQEKGKDCHLAQQEQV